MSCDLYSEESIKSGNIYCGYCNNDGDIIEECTCGYVRNMQIEYMQQ